jgi:hypothetical protein
MRDFSKEANVTSAPNGLVVSAQSLMEARPEFHLRWTRFDLAGPAKD